MRKIILALLAALLPSIAAAQVPFPQTLPASTVYGRLGISAGPGQAIPFSILTNSLATSVFAYTTHGDSDFVIPLTTRTAATSAALTAPRTWTLPASATMTPGQPVCIADVFGGVTSTNTLTLARSGADTINGATTFVLRAGFAGVCLIPDGTTKWNTVSAVDSIAGLTPVNRALLNTDGSGVPFLSATPTIGVNGGTGGQITYNGSTSGSVATKVPAAAGAGTVFQYPGSNGTNKQVLVTDGAGLTSWGTAVDFQVFTATGANTWTRPGGVTVTRVIVCGAGGGGGGGARVAATTAGSGGGGGGGGYCNEATYKSADLGASQTVTIAAGGPGGTGGTVNGTNGNTGSNAGNTTFGSLLTGTGGGGGQGGLASTNGVGGGGGGGPNVAGSLGVNTSVALASSTSELAPFYTASSTAFNFPCMGVIGTVVQLVTANVPPAQACPNGGGGGGGSPALPSPAGGWPGQDAGFHGPGGGGGGGINNTTNFSNAGAGGRSIGCPTAPAAGATSNGGSTAADFTYHPGCGGGGGAGSGTFNGGNGTNSGGGGGGGVGNNVNAGNGGTGGNGFAVVISW